MSQALCVIHGPPPLLKHMYRSGVVAHVRKRAFTHTEFEREGENERVLIVGQLDWLDVCFDVCNQKDCILCDKDDNRMSIP